jgi:uncharacterized protein YdbL (DUF1318 family)
VNSWRNELLEVAKSKADREAEDKERHRKRIAEALEVADEAMSQALDGLRFAVELLQTKEQQSALVEDGGEHRFELHGSKVVLSLDRETAVLAVQTNEGRPRDFDFAKDRHLAPKDVEEYVGRRLIELARAAQKENPW